MPERLLKLLQRAWSFWPQFGFNCMRYLPEEVEKGRIFNLSAPAGVTRMAPESNTTETLSWQTPQTLLFKRRKPSVAFSRSLLPLPRSSLPTWASSFLISLPLPPSETNTGAARHELGLCDSKCNEEC